MVKKLLVLLLVCGFSKIALGQKLMGYVTVNTSEAYIGQPVELKVSIFSSTWFTSGIDVGNIKVDGALTVYQRSVSQTKTINKTKYAGVEFYYLLFPTKSGELIIPSLSVDVETPAPGDYKGRKRVIKTAAKTLNSKSIPTGYNKYNWLVTSYFNVNDKWDKKPSDVKVGDVLKRTITRSAGNTLSEFIPETLWPEIDGVSMYPNRAKVNTNYTRTSVSSSRTESVNYLFEQEGEVIIPAIEYIYWNPRNKKFYKRQLDSIILNVAPNEDLEVLASIKKSLQKQREEAAVDEEEPLLIFGLSPKQFALYCLYVLLGLIILYKILKYLIGLFMKLRTNYRNSEAFTFLQVKKAIKKHNYIEVLKSVKTWTSKRYEKPMTLMELGHTFDSQELIDQINAITNPGLKHEPSSNSKKYDSLFGTLKKIRKNTRVYSKTHVKSENEESHWLNPTSLD